MHKRIPCKYYLSKVTKHKPPYMVPSNNVIGCIIARDHNVSACTILQNSYDTNEKAFITSHVSTTRSQRTQSLHVFYRNCYRRASAQGGALYRWNFLCQPLPLPHLYFYQCPLEAPAPTTPATTFIILSHVRLSTVWYTSSFFIY